MITERALHALDADLHDLQPYPDRRPSAPEDVQPYPGLRPFAPEESRYFKGRDVQVEEIIQRLARDRCVVVLGGSGCGKSSIVRAGVIPALRLKMIPGRGDFWRVAICSPGRAPVANLVDALDGLLAPERSGERRKQIRDVLYGSEGLGGFLPAFKQEIPLGPELSEAVLDKGNLLVLIDQFEELFREENRGKAETAALAGFIIDAWRGRDRYPGLYLILTMRTDDLHRCAEFIDLPDVINASGYLTRRLKETELRQAIVEPVRPAMLRAGLLAEARPSGMVDVRPYDVQVVTELLDAVEEIAHDPDHLPLLQHLLAVLWRTALARWHQEAAAPSEAAEPRVTLQDLAQTLGCESWDDVVRERSAAYGAGVGGWLLRHGLEHVAEELYAGSLYGEQLTTHQQEIGRVAFCLMGEVDDRGNFKRRWTNREEIARVAGLEKPDADVEAVIRRFYQDHRLLWVRQSGIIDVSHESLMRNWPRMGKQLEEDRDAGAAYRHLVDHYAGRQEAQQRQFWPSWLTQWFGLLPAHELGRVERLLAPRYNRYWSERFIADEDQKRDAEATGTQRKALLGNGAAFLARREYLWRSKKRNSVAWGMKLVLGIVVLIGLGYGGSTYWYVEKERKTAIMEKRAAYMWGTLTSPSSSPVMPDEYVRALWQLATQETAFRSMFVDQLETLPQSRAFGFRPQPVIRAVGLRWPEHVRKVGLRALLEQSEKSLEQSEKSMDAWDLMALACAVEALGERIDPASNKRALELLDKYVRGLPKSQILPPQLFSLTRVFACVGEQLQGETKTKALGLIKNAVESATTLDSSDIFAIANAANAATLIASDLPESARNAAFAFTSAIDGLRREMTGFRATLMARPLAPLMATLPHQEQKKAFGQLLSFVATKIELDADEVLLLVFAQAVEVLAEPGVSANGNPLTQWLSSKEGVEWLTPAKSDDVTVAHLAVARLMAPLALASEMRTPVMHRLLHIADVEASSDDPTAAATALLQALKETAGPPTTLAERLRLGLRGRLLATLVTQGYADKADLTTVEEVIRATTSSKKPEQPRQPSSHFALEGLARALAAVAPYLRDNAREKALQTAREQLADTGSAEEAAAWSRAIATLIESEKDLHEFVKQTVEVLKYPTTALIAREPGASEPHSATDILVETLRSRLELLKEKLSWDGGLQRVLDEIKQDKRFKDIDLTTPPERPKTS